MATTTHHLNSAPMRQDSEDTVYREANSSPHSNPMEKTEEREEGQEEHHQQKQQQNHQNASADNEDSAERGEEEDQSKKPVHIFHKSLHKTWSAVLLRILIMIIVLFAFIIAVLSLFWGSLFKAYANANRIPIYIVNFDSAADALVGPTILDIFMSQKTNPKTMDMTLGFVEMDPSIFGNDPMNVREAVYYEEAYAAVIINANATTLLRQAVQGPNASYDPLGAAQVIYNEARDDTAYYDFIYPIMNPLLTQAVSMVGKSFVAETLKNTSITQSNLAQVPQALSPAIGFSIFNLRPFYLPVAIPAVSVGLIYLIIISFFSFSFFMPIHSKFIKPEGHPPAHYWHFVAYRWVVAIMVYFFLSLAYSLVSLAFQIPFSNDPAPPNMVSQSANPFGKATFVVYWMLNWVGMAALGLACENMAMILGNPWASMFLIFWVISNVATSFYPVEIEPRFYYWGYAWPLKNVVEASRTLIFDTASQLGLNFGVLFAWIAVNSVLFPFASMIMRWKQKKGWA